MLGLPAMVLLGVGTMVGGGFYALLGEVVGEAGLLAPLALLCAGLLALVNGYAFGALSARFPVSAGEVRYVDEGFGRPWLARLTGACVIATGVVSAATLTVATAGFLGDLVPVPRTPGVLGVGLVLGLFAAWGVGRSMAVVGTITVIEVGALLVVLALDAPHLPELPGRWAARAPVGGLAAATSVFSAAFLAFYAFIGFEDMVNMAEEVERPRRVLPRAILLSVLLTTVLYVVVSVAGLAAVPVDRIAASSSPVAALVGERGPTVSTALVVISLLTGVNGALVQLLMASRVAYGMARAGRAPRWFGRVHPRTRTPVRATAVVTGVVLVLAAAFPLASLARATSTVILVVFALVNLALVRIAARERRAAPARPAAPAAHDGARAPGTDVVPPVRRWIPALGFASCVVAVVVHLWVGG